MAGIEPIKDPAESGAEQRRHVRKKVIWSARLDTAQGSFSCIILNVSRSGAKLRLPQSSTLSAHQPIELVFEAYGALPAEIIWQRGDQMGIHFTADPTQVAAIIGASLGL
jgi:PilZ domain